jgi:hypothetical protein
LSGAAARRDFRVSASESHNDVGKRAIEFVENEVLGRFDAPQEAELENPETLPEGMPHVVIVGHNLFLTELYEGLLFWHQDNKEGNVSWTNASWWVIFVRVPSQADTPLKRSRHIICYDMATGELELEDMCRAGRINYFWKGNLETTSIVSE